MKKVTKLTPEQRDLACQMYLNGEGTLQSIAKQFGVNTTSIWSLLKTRKGGQNEQKENE
jgi:transposase-like protein